MQYTKDEIVKPAESPGNAAIPGRVGALLAGEATAGGDSDHNKGSAIPSLLATETVLYCLFRLGIRRGVYVEIGPFKRQNGLEDRVELARVLSLGSAFGLEVTTARLQWQNLIAGQFTEPVMLLLDNGNVVLAVGVERSTTEHLAVIDPLTGDGRVISVGRAELERVWGGWALLATTRPELNEKPQVGFRWFARRIFAEHRAFRDILIAAVAMHALALATPIFFQVLIDKVIPNSALYTLYVLATGMAIVTLFDAGFSFARNTLLAHVQRKLDFLISADTVEHLLSLPMTYFDETPGGVIVHTVQEATNVREFLTGRLFNVFLDLLAIVLFLPLLLIYSWQLTLLVILFSATSFGILGIVSSKFRLQVEALNRAEGKRKTLLVEIAHGIMTIKSMAIEPGFRQRWRYASSDTAALGLALGRIAAAARAVLGGLEKTLTVMIGGFGVLLVLNDQITVGALVAFNMIGLRVSGPLIQSGSLLQDFQKAAASLGILRQLLERRPEQQTGQLTPSLKGAVNLEKVTFYYPGSDRPALNDVSCRIEPGQTVGIVGRSGSGKTTITRLIQGLYLPQSGLVTLDDQDIKEIDLGHLRSQVGVVLQDSFLFRGTVRENIAMAKPHASLEEVMRVAQLAGAHGFIQRMRQGYASMLEEGANNLSGGQRQRLSIARALLADPPILIFDEATSSLDPESEAILQTNLKSIAKGRTTIIVTHRLNFVHAADQILVLDEGSITLTGSHQFLLGNSPLYRQLWQQQGQAYR